MAAAVEPSIFSFLNHGCNGTYNTGMALDETEQTVPLGRGPVGIVKDDMPAYHPWLTRHFPSSPDDINIALRDIYAGEEILENYLVFGGVESIEDWDENLSELQTICAGGSGLISKYEQEGAASV
jgi:hypothetical protein